MPNATIPRGTTHVSVPCKTPKRKGTAQCRDMVSERQTWSVNAMRAQRM